MPYLLLAVLIAAAATARPVLDQEAPYGTATIQVGGTDRNWIVAQTVTAGVTGDLMRVELGVGCASGELILEIRNLAPRSTLPGAAVRSSITIPASEIPEPPSLHTFELDHWPSMSAGDEFAIVLRNDSGTCTVLKGPEARDGSSYRAGQGFFTHTRNPAGAWLQFLDFGHEGDLGFKTIVNVPASSPPCVVNGFALPFASWLPVCRCISDEGLRDFRCALMHPDYFAIRNIPSPLHAGEKFKVKWTLTAAAPMKGVVEILDKLPPEFGGSPKAPLTFFVEQLPPGQSITLTYDAVAPLKPGRYKVDSAVSEGSMQTVIEVLP